MSDDLFRQQFAFVVADAFQRLYPDIYQTQPEADCFVAQTLMGQIEKPKDPKMGRFSLPVFRHAKVLKQPPPVVASAVAEQANQLLESSAEAALVKAEAAAGFINARVDFQVMAGQTLKAALEQGAKYGEQDVGKDKTVLVEYCSANIAKPFGIGHLRSTVVGNSLRRIFLKLGYNVVGINYLGDWGTQFGKMIVAWQRWGGDTDLTDNALHKLLDLYVRFHDEAESDPELNDLAREAFRRLEDGHPEAVALWEKFKAISMTELDRIYDILGVQFDWITSEAFFNDKMDAAIERLEKAGLTEISEGALVVPLDDPQLPPCLLRKSDGATLYATRELASFLYRWEKYHFHESLYVVGREQADHFRQLLGVIRKLEDAENQPKDSRWSDRVRHVGFGWVRFGDLRMSTRKGQIVFLEDVYEKATSKAREIIREKNPDLAESEEIAYMVGVGAVLFCQLSVRRQKDVNLIWDQVLSFEGETGPYLQYTHARLCSLLRNYGVEVTSEFDVTLLDREEESRIVEILADFSTAVSDAAKVYDPQIIAAYLLRLAGAFNRFYQRKNPDGRIEKILSDDKSLSAARIAIVKAVQTVLREGLYLLGLKAPEAM